jgi:hypothetical protein
MNSKTTTTDGYLAIPVSMWELDILTKLLDFNEFAPGWAGGFWFSC